MNETQENTNVQTSKLQAVVDYLPGMTIFNASPALLEWTADDRVRFFKMNFDTMQATKVLFDVPVGQIERVSGSAVMLTFYVSGQKYNAQFSQTGMAKLGVGGAVGIAASAQDAQASGIYGWTTALKAAGVPLKFYGMKWAFMVALGIVAAVVVVALVIYLLDQ